MAASVDTINLGAYSDALIILGTAGILVPIVRRFGLSSVLAYLGAGAALGPLGLGSFIHSFPVLYWFTIVDADNVAGIAQLGIVFLLFLIGLELSFNRLMTMRRLVFGLGTLQVLLTSALLAMAIAMAGETLAVAMILGTSLSLSSTAIVLDLLANQGRLATATGRASFSVLLAQDLAVIPILLFVSILGTGTAVSVLASLGTALLQAGLALAFIVIVGRVLLRPLFRLVATTQSSDLFIAAVLFVIVAAGLVAHQAGLSMPLGAFVAGLLLAETEYGKAIQAAVEPFKALLLGIFFFTVGMNINLGELVREPGWLFGSALVLIALKWAALTSLAKLFRLSWPGAIETGLLLAPAGEFAFVVIGAGTSLGVVNPHMSSLALAVTSITMALSPLLATAARRMTSALASSSPLDAELSVRPASGRKHAIVVGYGRVGKVVCSLLRQHDIPYIAADNDAPIVARDRRDGHDVYYGDATDLGFLKICGLMDATGIIITINSPEKIDDIVGRVRAERPDLLIVSRARDADHARHLYSVGASDVVPETIEASLQLSETALIGLGVASGAAIASIHEKRDEFRRALQRASQAGMATRAKA